MSTISLYIAKYSDTFIKFIHSFKQGSEGYIQLYTIYIISRFMQDINKQRRDFISVFELGHGPQEFNSRRVRLHLTK